MNSKVDDIEDKELAQALLDLFLIIDGFYATGDVEIKNCRRIQYARTVFEKLKKSDVLPQRTLAIHTEFMKNAKHHQ